MDKIDKMHAFYGIRGTEQCKNCCNYIRYRYHDRQMRKCIAYGDTRSAATDWAGTYTACGLFGEPFDTSKQLPAMRRTQQIDSGVAGQVLMEGI